MDGKQFRVKSLAGSYTRLSGIRYKVLHCVEDFEEGCESIIVNTLDPDYYLLLGSIGLIVTERGSALSHLAIVAREHNLPVLLVENIISEIPERGVLSLDGNTVKVENDEKAE